MTEALEIKKEDIEAQVHFAAAEVLVTKEAREKRIHDLEQAMLLGNAYKGKIKIVFATTEGPRFVETTVWAATEKNIALKGDVIIPVHSIIEVIL